MQTTKLLLGSALVGALLLPLISCGSAEHDPLESYYLVTVNSKIPYWKAAAAGLQQAAMDYKVRWEVAGPENYDPQAEKAEFRKVLKKKPSGILVSVSDPTILQPEIDAAIAQGVPVITMDSDAPASKRLLFIGTNNYEAGQMGGKVVAEKLQGKGNVMVFSMPEQPNMKERLHGYEQALRAYPGIKITEVVDMKGDASIAFDRTMDVVTKNGAVDAFVCLEAQSCPEVAEVLNRKQVKGKLVVAMDTDPRTLDWIQKGLIAATIAQKPFTMAFFGTRVLDQLQHRKLAKLDTNFSQDTRSPLPSFIDTGATLIDSSNVQGFISSEAGK